MYQPSGLLGNWKPPSNLRLINIILVIQSSLNQILLPIASWFLVIWDFVMVVCVKKVEMIDKYENLDSLWDTKMTFSPQYIIVCEGFICCVDTK